MFYKIINLVKLNLNLKNNVFKTKLIKSDFTVLKLFLKLNIIKSVKLHKNDVYFIKLNNNTVLKNLMNLYKPSRPCKIDLKTIIKVNRKKYHIFYISTNMGVINNIEAEKNKVGGILILKIWI